MERTESEQSETFTFPAQEARSLNIWTCVLQMIPPQKQRGRRIEYTSQWQHRDTIHSRSEPCTEQATTLLAAMRTGSSGAE